MRHEVPQGGGREPASRPRDDPQGAADVREGEVAARAAERRRSPQRLSGYPDGGCEVDGYGKRDDSFRSRAPFTAEDID